MSNATDQRVLVAEDDPVYRRVLERFLSSKGYQVIAVRSGSEALQVAHSADAPRVLMLDWMMPGLQGPEVCVQLRNDATERYQYIILLTSKDTKADIIAGLEAGADDYLTKPFDSHELLARVRVGVRLVELQDRLIAAQENLRFQATHDALTGVWNRGALFELLQAEAERCRRKATALTLLMIDLDHFKRVNDEFGHPVGDVVLREVARRLSASVRSYDIVGRYGGEEFLIGAVELDPEKPHEFAERLHALIFVAPVDTPRGAVSVTGSIGIATTQPYDDCGLEKLIQAADAALYAAKQQGRNGWSLAPSSPCAAEAVTS